jgi:hypothetical protein
LGNAVMYVHPRSAGELPKAYSRDGRLSGWPTGGQRQQSGQSEPAKERWAGSPGHRVDRPLTSISSWPLACLESAPFLPVWCSLRKGACQASLPERPAECWDTSSFLGLE